MRTFLLRWRLTQPPSLQLADDDSEAVTEQLAVQYAAVVATVSRHLQSHGNILFSVDGQIMASPIVLATTQGHE